MKNIVLASASPRRHELLEQINLHHEIMISNINEKNINNLSPTEYVKNISYQKAKYVSNKLNRESIVISADTIVVKDKRILGKPINDYDAFNILKFLSNGPHYVKTGLTVLDIGNNYYYEESIVEKTKVFMRNYKDDEILNYIKTNEHIDKAGAYGIQGIGSLLVDSIEGDYYNVVGLPLSKLAVILKKFGVNIL